MEIEQLSKWWKTGFDNQYLQDQIKKIVQERETQSILDKSSLIFNIGVDVRDEGQVHQDRSLLSGVKFLKDETMIQDQFGSDAKSLQDIIHDIE